ncbi:MAG: agmatinase family protein [Bacteroidota bacterium]|jgi:agmatinase
MTKKDKIKAFNPNDPGDASGNLYGLPFTNEESDFLVLPLPWEVTVSYGAGTALSPMAIREASLQVDLFSPEFPDLWKSGIGMLPLNKKWKKQSAELRKKAVAVIDHQMGSTMLNAKDHKRLLDKINTACERFHEEVFHTSLEVLASGKSLIGLGGDHSTPFGIIRAYAEKYPGMGILHFDAHCDLRKAYEEFTWSHASIFYNVLEKVKGIKKIVQAGIRDLCSEEWEYAHKKGVIIHTDREIRRSMYAGESFEKITSKMLADLPKQVYISFDIDALDRKYCPNTGTPVPGGFEFEEALFVVKSLVKSGREIIGFDINETGNGEWDANVSARLLYNLCGYMHVSQKKSRH